MYDLELTTELKMLESTLGRRPQKRDSATLNYRARKKFGSWNNFMIASGYDVHIYQEVTPANLNETYGYFIGLLITDGHIRYSKSKDYKIALYTSYDDEKWLIVEFIKNLFNYKAAITKRKYGFNKKENYEIHAGKITKDRKTGMAFSIRICRYQDRLRIKEMYNSSRWYYKRKKEKIDKI